MPTSVEPLVVVALVLVLVVVILAVVFGVDVDAGVSPPRLRVARAGPGRGRRGGPPVVDKRGRTVVDVSWEYLLGLYEGRTEVEGGRLAAPYIGKWLRVAGKVRNVIGAPAQVAVVLQGPSIAGPYLYFTSEPQRERASLLAVGTPISVLGRIDGMTSTTVYLRDCEFVEARTYDAGTYDG